MQIWHFKSTSAKLKNEGRQKLAGLFTKQPGDFSRFQVQCKPTVQGNQ